MISAIVSSDKPTGLTIYDICALPRGNIYTSGIHSNVCVMNMHLYFIV